MNFKLRFASKLVVLGGATLGLAACGSSSQPISAQASASGASTSAASTGSSKKVPKPPAAAGLVAAVSPTQMQVQSTTSGEVTVTWTSTTKFTVTSLGSISSVANGDCVRVVTLSGTARQIAILGQSGTSCSALPNAGNFGGRRKNARPGFGVIVGTVTSVSSSSISINPVSASGTSTTASLSSTTRVTNTSSGSSSNLADGDCVVVRGSTNSIGTVSATAVAISPSVSGTCVAAGGRGLGGGGFGGAGG